MTEFTADSDTFTAAHCLGHHHLHDARHDGEPLADLETRHRAAAEVCTGCPGFTLYAALHRSLPRSARAFGVWAGQSFDRTTTIKSKENTA